MRQQIQSLQVFRGIAALAVVGHHAVQSTSAFIGTMPNWVHNTIGQGLFGVDFFFVLSGFIIMFIHQNDDKNTNSIKRYATKRFLRVFPVYWAIAIPLAAAYYLLPGISESGGREINILSSALLLPGSGAPILSVAWTLIHEVMFYVFFILFFYSSRSFVLFVVFWMISIFAANISGEPLTGSSRYLFSILNTEFVIGLLSAKILSRVSNIKVAAMLCIGGIVLGLSSIYAINNGQPNTIRILFAIGMAMLIVGTATIERLHHFTWPSVLILLGNASYSIYLVHNPALSVTQRILGSITTNWPIGLLSGIILTTIFGVIFHLIIEKRLVKAGRELSKRTPLLSQ